MRLGLRQIANLVLVGVVALVALTWATIGLAGIRPFDNPRQMRVHLAQTGGALPGAEVTYLGVPIGKVTTARLVDGAAELSLTVRPKGPMAKVLRADVRQKSSLGEPYVDLAPADPADKSTADPDGALVPVERTSQPRALYDMLDQTERVLSKVEPGDLGAMADGLSGIVGHEEDLRTLLNGWADVGEVLGRRSTELRALMKDSARLTATLDAQRNELGEAISSYARLGTMLGRRTAELESIVSNAAELGVEGSDLLARSRADLEGVMAGLDVTFRNLAARPQKMRETIYWIPNFAERLGYTLEGNTMNIGLGGGFPLAPGYHPRFGVPIYGEGLRLDKIFVPTIAQRIDVDLAGAQQGRVIALVSPEDARYASKSTQNLLEIIERERAEVERNAPGETP